MDSNVYGPALPPGFMQREDSDKLPVLPEVVDKENPSLKSLSIIGPQLPSELLDQKKGVQSEDSDCDQVLECGSKNVIGPALPPGFTMGQTAGHEDSDSDIDSMYGPLPAVDKSESVDDVITSIERRATDMKKKLQGADKPVDNAAKREEWMTLPATDYKNQFGIISRCLADDSQAKSSNKRSRISLEEAQHSVKDELLKEELEKYNKAKRSKSLLEIHKKHKKEKRDKESKKPKERKAFDRDAELGIRLMDQRQVNSVVRNAKKLNSRFAAGASQYL